MSFDPKIFDPLLEAVFIIDETGKVTYCNETAASLCEMSIRKITRRMEFAKLFTFSEPVQFLADLKTVTEPTPYQELGFVASSGKTGKVQVTAQKFNSEPADWAIFFRDVTLEETLQNKYRAELDQVKNYSQNLENMVNERTSEVKRLNRTMTALLDSLQSGFLIFDKTGTCLDVFSSACESVLEVRPYGRKIWDVLRLPSEEVSGFEKWLSTLFLELLPFEDLIPLGPKFFQHSKQRHISLEYYPIRQISGAIEGVVLVATDITNLVEAQKLAEEEKSQSSMIVNLVRNKRHVASFIRDTRQLLTQLEIELEKERKINIDAAYRIVHTIKGGAASFSIKAIVDTCHLCESQLTSIRQSFDPEKWSRLSDLCSQVEEKFLRFQIENIDVIGAEAQHQERFIEGPVSQFLEFRDRYLNRAPLLAHMYTEKIIMVSVGEVFSRYNEVVRSIAENLGKELDPIEWHHPEIKILPEVYQSLVNTFIHAFRNALDHGIETPDERAKKGKSRSGKLSVKFDKLEIESREFLLIELRDDGAGIDPVKIRSKLAATQIDCSKESDQEVIQHIFDSQFSTRDQVTETSGRGVGMDAIASVAKEMGGSSWVISKINGGTSLFVRVPIIYYQDDKKSLQIPSSLSVRETA